jgi:hypothetical protein
MNGTISGVLGTSIPAAQPLVTKRSPEADETNPSAPISSRLAALNSEKAVERKLTTAPPLMLELATSGYRNIPPQIIPPEVDMNKFIEILRLLQMNYVSADVNQSASNTQALQHGLEQQNKKILSKQEEIQSNNRKIKEQSEVHSTVGKVVSVVSLLLGVLPLLLAAGPLALLVAAFTLVFTLYSTIVSFIPPDILKTRTNAFGETVQVDISISGLVSWLCELTATSLNDPKVAGLNGNKEGEPNVLSRSKFEDYKFGWSIAVNILIALPALIFGGSQIIKLFSTGEFAKLGMKVAETTSKILSNVSSTALATLATLATAGQIGQILIGLTSIGSAIARMFLAGDRKNLALLKIDLEQINQIVADLKTKFDLSTENFRSSLNFQDTLRKVIANALANQIEPNIKISNNA